MKKGIRIYLKNKLFFYKDKFFIPIKKPILFAKKIKRKVDFLYIIDTSKTNENLPIIDKLTYILPIIVETCAKNYDELIKLGVMVRKGDKIVGKTKTYDFKEPYLFKNGKKYAKIIDYEEST